MRTRQPTTTATLDDQPIPVRAKLAAAWTSFMFLYAYVDILGFYTPGVVDDILDGKVYEFDLSQTFSTTVLTVLAIPMFMIVLSTTLPARANRITNLVVAALFVPFTVFNVAGGFYLYFYGLGVALELVVLALIVRYAWTWPRTAPSATTATTAAMSLMRRLDGCNWLTISRYGDLPAVRALLRLGATSASRQIRALIAADPDGQNGLARPRPLPLRSL